MIFRSANNRGFIFKTEDGDVKVSYEDRIKVQTYLRQFEGTLVSIHLERKDKKLVMVTDRKQLIQIPIRDVVHMEVIE